MPENSGAQPQIGSCTHRQVPDMQPGCKLTSACTSETWLQAGSRSFASKQKLWQGHSIDEADMKIRTATQTGTVTPIITTQME